MNEKLYQNVYSYQVALISTLMIYNINLICKNHKLTIINVVCQLRLFTSNCVNVKCIFFGSANSLSYPTVWCEFTAKESRNSDQQVKYWIQDLPEDRFDDAIKFLADVLLMLRYPHFLV